MLRCAPAFLVLLASCSMFAVAPSTQDPAPGGNVGDAPAGTIPAPPTPTRQAPIAYGWHVVGKSADQVETPALPNPVPVAFLYEQDAGRFPRFYAGKEEHGGIPQRANIAAHLDELSRDIQRDIPDPNFNGWAVIDYESWDPVWELTKPEYREASKQHTRRTAGPRAAEDIERLAKASYESAAKRFMLETIRHCKKLRPRAKWGYYALPWGTYAPHQRKTQWLWDASDALYPCLYADKEGLPPGQSPNGSLQRDARVYEGDLRLRLQIAERLGAGKPVIPILWVRYDGIGSNLFGKFVTDADLEIMLRVPREERVDGIMFWNTATNPGEAGQLRRFISEKLTPALPPAGR
ncbi:MAG: hypothetical protein ACKVZJ_12210 [Phycisphaerales bacterium]